MQDNDGRSALMSASSKEHTEVAALLLEKGAHIKGVFKPGDRVGQIALRYFCVVKVGKTRREDEAPSDTQEKRVKRNLILLFS